MFIWLILKLSRVYLVRTEAKQGSVWLVLKLSSAYLVSSEAKQG